MSLVSQQQLLQNQLQLKHLDSQRSKQAQQSKSIVSSVSTANDINTNNSNNATVNNSAMPNSSMNIGSTAGTIDNNIDVRSNNTNNTSNKINANDNSKQIPTPAQFSNPLLITVPTKANPTEILASRFNSWRIIISALSHYLKESVAVHEEIIRQQVRLHHAISFPFITQGLDGEFYQPLNTNNNNNNNNNGNNFNFFHSAKDNSSILNFNPDSSFSNNNSNENKDGTNKPSEYDLARKFFLPLGSGSIQDLPTILYQYHSNSALLAQTTVKELSTTIIPRLEDLKRDLLVKIKEIRSLQTDFRNQVDRYQSETSRLLSTYIKSIDSAKIESSQLDPKNDPYLIKFALDRSIRRQLTEENYLHEAFINIQTSGKELEKVVCIELQTALTVYAKLLGQQAQNVFDTLISKMDSTILTKDPALEWDSFIDRDNKNFIELNLPMRRASEIRYKYQNESLTYEIRSGWLERKSKFLKSYQRAWYVLTPCFLHEFKSSDRKKDPLPERSLSLGELSVSEHSRKDEKNPNSYHKFVIMHGRGTGLLNKGHNWVFRAESYDLMMSWYNDIKRVTQLPSPVARSSIGLERKRVRRSQNIGDSSTSASIITGRRRGVSSATALTSTDNDNHTINNTNTTFSTVPEHIDSKNTNYLSTQMSTPSNDLSRQQTGMSSLSMGLLDSNDVVLVPIKHEIDNSKRMTIPENLEMDMSHNPQIHNQGQIGNLNTVYPTSNNLSSQVDPKLNTSPQSLAEQQNLLLQQQAILEQKQRQLLEEQRELQQRAFSLTSSVKQQYQQHQPNQTNQPSQLSQQVPLEGKTFSLDSNNSLPTIPNGKFNIEKVNEKVGELSIDENH